LMCADRDHMGHRRATSLPSPGGSCRTLRILKIALEVSASRSRTW
jgi:hypothetical protein